MGGSWASIFNYSARTKGGFLGNLRMCHHKRNQTMGNRGLNSGCHCIHDQIHFGDMERSHLTFLGKKGHNSSHQRRAIKVLLLIICHSTAK